MEAWSDIGRLSKEGIVRMNDSHKTIHRDNVY